MRHVKTTPPHSTKELGESTRKLTRDETDAGAVSVVRLAGSLC